MFTGIKKWLRSKWKPAPLSVAEAAEQFRAAQLSNDPEVRRAARAELDRAYAAAKISNTKPGR